MSFETKGWSGFQEGCNENIEFYTSKIIPLPFVDNPPSNYNIQFSSKKHKDAKQGARSAACFFRSAVILKSS